jgi:hypothetical protein
MKLKLEREEIILLESIYQRFNPDDIKLIEMDGNLSCWVKTIHSRYLGIRKEDGKEIAWIKE